MMTKFLSLGLLLASPILAQKPINARWGKDRVKLGEKTFILRDATASDAYVEMTAEMMKAGFWKYYKMQYDRYGYTKRGNEHKDRFVHENEFHLCLADHYLVHNFVDGVSATAESAFPTYKTVEGTPLRTSIWNGSEKQNKDSNNISEDNVEFSISEVKCKGDSSLWIMKTVYNVMLRNIPVDGITINPIIVERDGDNSSQLSCENCMDKLKESEDENALLKQQLQDALDRVNTLEHGCELDYPSEGEDCSLAEAQYKTLLSECNAEKDQCNQDLSKCNADNAQCSTCQSQLDTCNANQDACNACQAELTTCQSNLLNAEDECNKKLSACESERDTCNQENEDCNSSLLDCTTNNSCVGGLTPIGHDDFDAFRSNLDWKKQMHWVFYWTDVITSKDTQNVVFTRIPQVKTRGYAKTRCLDLGMQLATVRSDEEDELLYQWHKNHVIPEVDQIYENLIYKPNYGIMGSVTTGSKDYHNNNWYWNVGSEALEEYGGVYGPWGYASTVHEQTYSIRAPNIPIKKCFNRSQWKQTDKYNCETSMLSSGVNVAYTAGGWTNNDYRHNNWDALCEWRAPVNAARDFKLADTSGCFEFEGAAQKYVRFFGCPWIKSDKAFIETKCEELGLNLASVRSDAELKGLNKDSKFDNEVTYPTSASYSSYAWKWGDNSHVAIDDLTWSNNGARGNPGSTTQLDVGNGKVVPAVPGFASYAVLCEIRQEPPVVVAEE